MSFDKFERQIKVPFVIYIHFDSIQIRYQNGRIKHKPIGFGYSLKCTYDESFCKYEEYVGEDASLKLWQKLENDLYELNKIFNKKSKVQILNEEQKYQLKKINECYFCGEKLINEDKNEDFHPLSGELLGVAHGKCQMKNKIPNFVPVIMYNFSKYGLNFLMEVLKNEKLLIVGQNQGLIRNFGNNLKLHFIDTKQFIDEKIEDLEEILSDSKKRRLKKEYREKLIFDLIKKKIKFPYFEIDSFDKLINGKFPSKRGFFDQLNDEAISDEDYKRCFQIWQTFQCETVFDYFRIYLKATTYLVEDIFENFRNLCLDKYHLDPCHYFTIASFAWDAMLKYTQVKLEILKDTEMIDFIKKNIRGGLTQCSKRHAKANNKYCEEFDSKKPSTFIVYLDANNLGGWAMSQNLPFSDFRWLNEKEFNKIDIKNLNSDDEFGYFFEVDLEYPKELHELHNDLPFCSEHKSIKNLPSKPILCFYKKEKYGIDYRTLKQCLDNGLILTKIHRVLKFKQCKWLEPYISYNTNLRAKAKTDFETKLYKLLNNSVYGKTIQKTATDKPIYAGFSILELSKKFMYDFHYNFMLQKYKNINLLYIDTDGVIYEVETEDFYEDVRKDKNWLQLLDSSNLDKRWDIPSKNKKIAGKMKDEYGGKIIREFFGVGAKVYFLDVEGEGVKKAVGMKKYVKEKYITKKDYATCVFDNRKIKRSFMETTTKDFSVESYQMEKIVLSPGDKKRIILSDRVNTRAYGYLN